MKKFLYYEKNADGSYTGMAKCDIEGKCPAGSLRKYSAHLRVGDEINIGFVKVKRVL